MRIAYFFAPKPHSSSDNVDALSGRVYREQIEP